MIRSFADSSTADFWETGKCPKLPANLHDPIKKKLAMLNAAIHLQDLRVPPGNHLEELKGDRVGQHSIKINDRYRVCFRWNDAGVDDVEVVDYH